MLFSHRVEQGYLALPRLCDGQPIGRLEMGRANDISEPEFRNSPACNGTSEEWLERDDFSSNRHLALSL
jgi:hypothetical protein